MDRVIQLSKLWRARVSVSQRSGAAGWSRMHAATHAVMIRPLLPERDCGLIDLDGRAAAACAAEALEAASPDAHPPGPLRQAALR